MSKMRKNRDVPHIGRGGADAAAAKGAGPDQPIPNANVSSVRVYRAIGYFPQGKGLLVGTDHPMYPGTDKFQKMKAKAGGADGRDLASGQ